MSSTEELAAEFTGYQAYLLGVGYQESWLRSAAARRERYVGPRLPEPLVTYLASQAHPGRTTLARK